MPDLIDTIVLDAVAAQNSPDKGSAFQKIHDEITELQRQGGGAYGAQFQSDLRTLNQKLHENGILSNMEIRGVEEGDPPSDKLFQKPDRIILSDGQIKGDLVKDEYLTGSRWFPEDQLSPTQTNILNQSKDAVGQQVWATRHPSPGLADSPDPPGPPHYGGPGGYGCAPSVSEILRRSGVLSQDEDPLNVQSVQNVLQDNHGWKPIPGTSGEPNPNLEPAELNLQPGDVICGYRKGDDPTFSGAGAHVGIVGEDGKVYAHGLTMDPANPGHKHEAWTESDISNWYNFDYDAGIVVLRAPDAG